MADGIHKIGADAAKALRLLHNAQTGKKNASKKFTNLIAERNEAVRPLLIQVRDYLATGHPVNGQLTWEKWANNVAGWSKRQLNNIINGRKPRDGKRPVKLRVDMLVTVGNREPFKLTNDMIETMLKFVEPGGTSVPLKEDMVVSFPIYLGGDEEVLTPSKFKLTSLAEELHTHKKGMYKGRRFANVILELIEEPGTRFPTSLRCASPAPRKQCRL